MLWAQVTLQCYNTNTTAELPSDEIRSLLIGPGDTVWVGTTRGLAAYRLSTADFGSNVVVGGVFPSCMPPGVRQIWCAFYTFIPPDGGALYYNAISGHKSWYRKAQIAPNSQVRSIIGRSVALEGNSLWLGTLGQGLYKFDGSSWVGYHPEFTPGMPDSFFYAIAIDAQGRKWLGTQHKGVVQFDGTNWVQMGLTGVVEEIFIDPTGTIWAAHTSGLHRWQGGSWVQVLPHRVRMMTYVNNELWLATSDTGVVRYNPATGQVRYFLNRANSNLPPGSVEAIAGDNQGRIFIGMFNRGFCVYDPTRMSGLEAGQSLLGRPFPNPARDYLFLPLKGGLPEKVGPVLLYDMRGQLVSQVGPEPGAEGLLLRLPPLPAGLYELRLLGEHGGIPFAFAERVLLY